jgi:hypothetical protein
MTNKEIFDQYKALRDKYIWVSGELHFSMRERSLWLDDTIIFEGPDTDETKESIAEALANGADPSVGYSGEYGEIDQAGVYSFDALTIFVPAQIGNYPPPNIEAHSYLEVLHIEVSCEWIDDVFPF